MNHLGDFHFQTVINLAGAKLLGNIHRTKNLQIELRHTLKHESDAIQRINSLRESIFKVQQENIPPIKELEQVLISKHISDNLRKQCEKLILQFSRLNGCLGKLAKDIPPAAPLTWVEFLLSFIY